MEWLWGDVLGIRFYPPTSVSLCSAICTGAGWANDFIVLAHRIAYFFCWGRNFHVALRKTFLVNSCVFFIRGLLVFIQPVTNIINAKLTEMLGYFWPILEKWYKMPIAVTTLTHCPFKPFDITYHHYLVVSCSLSLFTERGLGSEVFIVR